MPAPPAAAAAPSAAPAGHGTRPEGRRLVLLAHVVGFALVALLHGLDPTLGSSPAS